ncbi:MAG: NfeD family protein [Chromatiales bacterium]|jgi:membrane protein implicated in regulation of membrane protease activity
MSFEIDYWHWIVFGVLLVLSEIALTTFFILWFGIAAIIVGGIVFFVPGLTLSWQIFIWTLLSLMLAAAWFKYLKPLSIDRTKAGLSREMIVGEVGQVISVPAENRRGRIRFPAPILGSDEWEIISTDNLAEGDRVRVKDVSGNSLLVEKV